MSRQPRSGLGKILSLKVEWESLGISTKRPVSSFHPGNGKCCLPHQQIKDAASSKPSATIAALMMDCPLPRPQPLQPRWWACPAGTWGVQEHGTGLIAEGRDSDFTGPRLLHLPILREALNPLT